MDLTIAKKVFEISVLDFLLVQIVRQPFLVYGPNLFIGLFFYFHILGHPLDLMGCSFSVVTGACKARLI